MNETERTYVGTSRDLLLSYVYHIDYVGLSFIMLTFTKNTEAYGGGRVGKWMCKSTHS
jgi:hypothetical protein